MEPRQAPAARDRGDAWADLPREEILRLTDDAKRVGWRAAVRQRATTAPFFEHRMGNVGAANWHLLTPRPPKGRVLDIGCGFGSLLLGLGQHFETAVGVEFLSERVRLASLRAREDGLRNVLHARGSGLQLPFSSGAFDFVIMNGVLEWAALYSEGDPEVLQRRMLQEARRVLASGGSIGVAIENRFALESLLGFRDTHTGLPYVTALPRGIADYLARTRRNEPYRTYLYSLGGYRRLFEDAGFANVRVLDLLPSYNDYDVVVRPDDATTYRLLHRLGLARGFYARADAARRVLARIWPGAPGALAYTFLILAGERTTTVLDRGHPLWSAVAPLGIEPGTHRFACQSTGAAHLAVVTHTEGTLQALVELGGHASTGGPVLTERVRRAVGDDWQLAGVLDWQGTSVRCFQNTAAAVHSGHGM